MIIDHFGPHQADVFIPAMAVFAVAAALFAVPIVFAPALRGARGTAVRVLCGVLVVLAVGGAIALAVPAQRTLAAETPALQHAIASRYGIDVPASTASRLLDGDTLKPKDPALGPFRGEVDGQLEHYVNVHLVDKGHARYQLEYTPTSASLTHELPRVD